MIAFMYLYSDEAHNPGPQAESRPMAEVLEELRAESAYGIGERVVVGSGNIIVPLI